MDTFSLDLTNGHISQIFNVKGPTPQGLPTSVVLDPAGAYAYVATTITCTPKLPANTSLGGAVQGAILAYQVASDGKLGEVGGPTYLPGNPAYASTGFPTCGLDDATNPNAGNAPSALVIDSAGKYLFVATAQGGVTFTTNLNATPTPTVATLNSVGIVVFAVGSNGSLTQVPGSPFALQQIGSQFPSPSALAVTPTVFPTAFAICAVNVPPTTENLYVTDSLNYEVLNYKVSSTGALTYVSENPTGTVPSGVTVDPCNRFVYVANGVPDNNVSAFTICNAISLPTCPNADDSLLPVTGSPFTAGSGGTGPLGPIMMDAYANFLYVLNTGQGTILGYRVSTSTGTLTALTPTPVVTNGFPSAMAIRSDDSWMFVTNTNQGSVSEYAITPATGALTPQPAVQTDPTPWGVAVK
jgi:6-phosphogluconolactonase (cycloisomerase 2 family)